MKKYLVITETTSINGSRRYEKTFSKLMDATDHARKRLKKANVIYAKILEYSYSETSPITECNKVFEYKK